MGKTLDRKRTATFDSEQTARLQHAQVLTLDVMSDTLGRHCVTCSNLGGDTVAALHVDDFEQVTIAVLRSRIVEQCGAARLVTHAGERITAADNILRAAKFFEHSGTDA